MQSILPGFSLLTLLACLLAGGCIPHEELVNFNQGPDFDSGLYIGNIPTLRIQPDDILAINITGPDEATLRPYLRLIEIQRGGGEAEVIPGYLVDQTGRIIYPGIGPIKVAGLTIHEARDLLRDRLSEYLRDPIVDVRFLNFKFTVMGEVQRPSTYTLSETQVTVLEALGLAGDMTTYADRENILVIREQDQQREFGQLNLRDRRVFESPYFYLQQNDVIYVQPIKQKVATISDRTAKVLPWVSAATLLANLVILLVANNN